MFYKICILVRKKKKCRNTHKNQCIFNSPYVTEISPLVRQNIWLKKTGRTIEIVIAYVTFITGNYIIVKQNVLQKLTEEVTAVWLQT